MFFNFRWGCSLCAYKGFHRNGLMEHTLFEHRKTQDPICLSPDVLVEQWVQKLLEHQELIMANESGEPKLPSTCTAVTNATVAHATLLTNVAASRTSLVTSQQGSPNRLQTEADTSEKCNFSRDELEKAFGSFGNSINAQFACPKCDFRDSDETKMSDHLETELAKVR